MEAKQNDHGDAAAAAAATVAAGFVQKTTRTSDDDGQSFNLKNKIPFQYPKDSPHKPPRYIQIKQSSIAGLGCFATSKIPAGKTIGEYTGTIITEEESIRKRSAYMMTVQDGNKVLHVIDAANKKTSSWTRYINCCRHLGEQNAIFRQYKKKIYVRTMKDVEPGEEVLVFYGADYAEELLGYEELPSHDEWIRNQKRKRSLSSEK